MGTMNISSDAVQFLLLATKGASTAYERQQLITLFRSLGADSAWNVARENKIEALVGTVVADACEPSVLGEEWGNRLILNERRVELLLKSVSEVTRHFEEQGIPHSAVESAGVMLGSSLPFSALGSGDIDILVCRDRLRSAVDAFERAGFRAVNRRDRPAARFEMQKTEADGTVLWVNVFSVAFDRMWVPLTWSDQSDKWLSRRQESGRWPGINILKVEDSLAFVSMHTSLHSYVRSPGLRLHVDVDRLVRDNDVDWQEYVEQVNAMGVPKRAFFSVQLARELLGTPIPDRVLDSLAPSPFVRKYVRRLLDENGVIEDGHPKLTRWQTPLLDVLLHERGFFSWLGSALVPPRSWMSEHFGVGSNEDDSLLKLHWRRYCRLLTAWNPK